MVHARSLEEYRAIQKKRINKLGRVRKTTPIKAAKYAALQLRMLLPRKTGLLIQSVNRKGKAVRVGHTKANGFPVIHWINESPGFEQIHIGGKGPLRSYGSTNYTAKVLKPVDVARDRTRKYFVNIALKETRKAITLKT